MSVQTTPMKQILGGAFLMGSERFYPEERPVRPAIVHDFRIDETPVTNAQFTAFVTQTAYVTDAEKERADALPGSSVFVRPGHTDQAASPSDWWEWRAGACWRHPLGSESYVHTLLDHPVVHVSFADATAYAAWAGKSLPTEAEWEYAARAGLESQDYAWGNTLSPDGLMLANYWQGDFPFSNTLADGWERTSPVGAFPANAYGLYDMIGNVWEWTADCWTAAHERPRRAGCCSTSAAPPVREHVIKGGSHLCAMNYCQRFRPAARHPQPLTETTSHIGFRCVQRS